MQPQLPEPDADERAHSDRLLQLLQALIARHGPLPFSQYMERCLYAPGLGYYSAGRMKFGASGDFVTAPELGPVFAQCVASALAPTLEALGADADFLELGGGSGAFAEVALTAFADAGSIPRRYLMLEPSADLRERQRERLHASLPPELAARVHWLERPPEEDWRGVLFANEVIDALPTTRFAMHGTQIHEEHVEWTGDTPPLRRIDRPADALISGAVRHLERSLGTAFADGYRSELLPQLPYWMDAISGSLHSGLMLFVDYGYVRREFYLPERSDGTLMAHYRHHAHSDPLWWPGLNDLTASVDFTALAEACSHAGGEIAGYWSQAQFLIGAGLPEVFARQQAAATDVHAQLQLANQIRHLTLPEAMGERFQAMLVAKALPELHLPAGLLAADRRDRL